MPEKIHQKNSTGESPQCVAMAGSDEKNNRYVSSHGKIEAVEVDITKNYKTLREFIIVFTD